MANSHRGEIDAELGGRPYRLCLTLGALAELESRLGAGDLVALAQRFETGHLSARDLFAIIACGLRGGGAVLSDEEIEGLSAPGGLAGYIGIATRLIAATFGQIEEGDAANPRLPQDS